MGIRALEEEVGSCWYREDGDAVIQNVSALSSSTSRHCHPEFISGTKNVEWQSGPGLASYAPTVVCGS